MGHGRQVARGNRRKEGRANGLREEPRTKRVLGQHGWDNRKEELGEGKRSSETKCLGWGRRGEKCYEARTF